MKLVSATAWIVGSLLVIPGTVYKLYHPKAHVDYLCRLVQTGPQREALKTPYLAELIQLSADRPVIAERFDPLLARRKLRSSPVIKNALVKVIKPDTVYIDYTVCQPLAWLYDFDNVALDEEGVPFPIIPFFSPKKLPEIILGLQSFSWGKPLKNEKADLALTLLKMMLDKSLNILRLDVTASFAPSLGKREVVVILEENGFSKFLRLTPKNFAQELGNYLELRKTLPPETQVIDLRIPQLAFVEKPSK
jgi:hypothetical protein